MASRSSYYADSVATSFYSVGTDDHTESGPSTTAALGTQPAWSNPISLIAARKNYGSIISTQSSYYTDTESTSHAPPPSHQQQPSQEQLASPLTFKDLTNINSNYNNMTSLINFPHPQHDQQSPTTTTKTTIFSQNKTSSSTEKDLIPPSRLVNIRDFNTLSFSGHPSDSDASSVFVFDDTAERSPAASKDMFDSPHMKASPQIKASFPSKSSNITGVQDVLPPGLGPFMPHVYRKKIGLKNNNDGNSAYNTISNDNNITTSISRSSEDQSEKGIVLVPLFNSFKDTASTINSQTTVSSTKDDIFFNTRTGKRQSRVRSGMLPPLSTNSNTYYPPLKRTSFRPQSEAQNYETAFLNSQPSTSKLKDNVRIRQELEFARRIKRKMASKSIIDLESALSNFEDDNSTTNLILTSSSSRKGTSNILVDEKSNRRYDKDGTLLCDKSTELVILLFSFLFPPLWLLLGTGQFDSVIGRVSRQSKITSLVLAALVFVAIIIGVIVGIKRAA